MSKLTSEVLHTGEWWLSNDSVRMPGRLSFDQDNKQIRLQIFNNTYLDGTTVDFKDNKRPVFYHEIVSGDAHGQITLYQCSWSGTKPLGKNLYQVDYTIGYVFFGLELEKNKDMLVTAGEFMYPSFKSFYDTDPVYGHKSMFIPQYDVKNRAAIIQIKDNLKMQFPDRKNDHARIPFDEKDYRTVLFIYETRVKFETLLEDGIYFKKLIEFSYGGPCNCQLPTVWLDENTPVRIWNTSLGKGETVSQHLRPGYHMLLSDDNFEEGTGMIEAIRLWFKYKQVSTIFDLYIDSNYRFDGSDQQLTMVMYNNRFLNIVQALESFHRFTFSEQKPDVVLFNEKKAAVLKLFKEGAEHKDLKQWLNNNLNPPQEIYLKERLNYLLKWLKPEIDQWFSNQSTIDHFAWYASAMRNALSHGTQRQTRPPKELRLFMITGQVLLAACILKALKVKDVSQAVVHYQRFGDHLAEINRTVINRIG